MRLRYLVLLFISIGCFFMSSTTVESQESPPRIASKPMSLVWNIHLQDMLDRWSLAYPERQTPEIHSLREETLSDDQDLDNNKFEYLDKKFEYGFYHEFISVAAKAEKGEKNEVQDLIATHNLFFSILNPEKCPKGQQEDNITKTCRTVYSRK